MIPDKAPPTQSELDDVLALVRADRHASALGRIVRWSDVWADRVRLMVMYREGHHERATELAVALASRGWWDAPVAAMIALGARDAEQRAVAVQLLRSFGIGPSRTVQIPVKKLLDGDLGAWAVYVRGLVHERRLVEVTAAVTLAAGTGRFGPELWSLLAGELLLAGEVALARHVLEEGLTRFPAQPELSDAIAVLDAGRSGGAEPRSVERPSDEGGSS